MAALAPQGWWVGKHKHWGNGGRTMDSGTYVLMQEINTLIASYIEGHFDSDIVSILKKGWIAGCPELLLLGQSLGIC